MKVRALFTTRLRNFAAREDGSPLVEFAVVFPFLILLLAGVTEAGRMFYTYTTLAKATRAGARYLSSSRDFSSSDTVKVNAAIAAAKDLVVCGKSAGCSGMTPVAPGLTAGNVSVPPLVSGPVKYTTVSITNYQYQPLVFNMQALTGSAAFTKNLAPSTTMRYLR
jgi:Flp pilus assembly protein TadG